MIVKRERPTSHAGEQILDTKSTTSLLLCKLARLIQVSEMIKQSSTLCFLSYSSELRFCILLMFYLQSLLNVLQILWLYVCDGNCSDHGFVSLASITHIILNNMILLWSFI